MDESDVVVLMEAAGHVSSEDGSENPGGKKD